MLSESHEPRGETAPASETLTALLVPPHASSFSSSSSAVDTPPDYAWASTTHDLQSPSSFVPLLSPMQSAPPSATPASVHEMEPTLTLQETASAASLPAYDGPVPRGTTLLAAVKIDFGRPEEYFSTVRPVPLEDRLPNLVYATRISALNAALREPEMQRSIRYIGVFKPFALLASVACAAVAVGVYYALRNAFALVFLFVAGWMVFYLGPTNAKYTRKCEEMAAQWTKEDELSGINLQTIVRKTRNHKNSSRIDVTLVFTEKAHFSGDVVEEGESLPVYTE